MDELKIIWSNTAVNQRNKTFDYWNFRNENNEYSKKLNATIYAKIELIKLNPFIGIMGDLKPYRILYFGNYSLVYKKVSKIIYIGAFWDNRQNPNKLKKLLGL